MARTLTTTFEDQMKAAGRDSTWLLEITLPLKAGESQPVSVYSAFRLVQLGAQVYQATLREFSEVGFSEGFSIDGASGAIENASRVWGAVLSESDRSLDGANVVVKKAVKNAAGVWEADSALPGTLKDVKVNGRLVSFSIISDLSMKGAVVANDPVGTLPEMGAVAATVSGGDDGSGFIGGRITPGDRRFYGGGRFLPDTDLIGARLD